MANEFIIKHGFHSKGNAEITGSLIVSGNISSSNGIITATTGAFNHIITDEDTIEFRNKTTGNQTGKLKFDSSTGLNVLSNTGARTKVRAGKGEFLSLEAGPEGINSIGPITGSSHISSSATITANAFVGGGSGITGVVSASYALTASHALNAGGGGGGSPGGSDTQVQFNDGGSFGGDAGFTYNKTTNSITGITHITSSGNISSSANVIANTGSFNRIIGTVANTIFTLDFTSGQLSTRLYAPYNLAINSVTNIVGSPTTTITSSGSPYTLGNAITVGTAIDVTASVSSVINLNITR